jgi:hypothetical protein
MKTIFLTSDTIEIFLDASEYQAIVTILGMNPALQQMPIPRRIYEHMLDKITKGRSEMKQKERTKK